jgi:hypothetical protein
LVSGSDIGKFGKIFERCDSKNGSAFLLAATNSALCFLVLAMRIRQGQRMAEAPTFVTACRQLK